MAVRNAPGTGKRSWTAEQVSYLVAHWATGSMDDLIANTGRANQDRVREKAMLLGLRRDTTAVADLERAVAKLAVLDAGGKACNKCGEWRPVASFRSVAKDSKDGLTTRCRECVNVEHDQWRARHPGVHAARESARYWADVERGREIARRAGKRYRARHPMRRKALAHRRRVAHAATAGGFTAQEWQDLKSIHGHRCLRCDSREPEIKLTPDHVIPLAKGGHGEISNIQPLCHSCNARKGTKSTDYRQGAYAIAV